MNDKIIELQNRYVPAKFALDHLVDCARKGGGTVAGAQKVLWDFLECAAALTAQPAQPAKQQSQDALDAACYRWIRMRVKVKKMQSVSGSIRDAIDIKIGCSFLDSSLPHGIPNSYHLEQAAKLDTAIKAAIAAMEAT